MRSTDGNKTSAIRGRTRTQSVFGRHVQLLLVAFALCAGVLTIWVAVALGASQQSNRQFALSRTTAPQLSVIQAATDEAVYPVTAQSIDHMLFYSDEYEDGGTLDFYTLCIGIDDDLGLVGFIMSFYSPFYGLMPGETVMFVIDSDNNRYTGDGEGYEYKLAVDRTYSGTYAYLLDLNRPQGSGYWAVPVDYSLDLPERVLLIAVPEYYFPNPQSFRFLAFSGNADGVRGGRVLLDSQNGFLSDDCSSGCLFVLL